MRRSRPLTTVTALAAGLALTAALATTLSGCTMKVVEGADPSTSGRPSTTAEAPVTPAPPAVDAPPDAPAAPAQPGNAATRADLIANATIVKRCTGELTILQDRAAIRIEGSCDGLMLNTSGSRIVADDSTYLSVIGDDNIVFAGTVKQLLVNGTRNTVHWTGETPTVTDVGDDNILTAG